VAYKTLTKKEKQKNLFNQTKGLTRENIVNVKSEYKIIGFSKSKNTYKIYWLQLQTTLTLFAKRKLAFIEEKDADLLKKLQKEYSTELIHVTDKCPACTKAILTTETECKNCGLHIVA